MDILQNKSLSKTIRLLKKHTDILKHKINHLLYAQNKTFTVIREDKTYDFFVPTTRQEDIEMGAMREELIDLMVKDAIMYDDFSTIIALTQGIDPRDFQVEKIHATVIDATDSQGNAKTNVPLNEDSIYVKWQRDKDCDNTVSDLK